MALTDEADPVVFSFLRDVGGATLLLLACKLQGCLVWPRREDVGAFILLGILGVYIAQMFQTLALVYVDPLNAAVLQPSQPVLTVFFAALLGVEPLALGSLHGRLKFCGVILAAAGAIATIYWDSQAAHGDGSAAERGAGSTASPSVPGLVVGNALLVVQCLSGALYQLVQKHLLSTADYPPLAVAGFGYLIGAVSIGLVLPVCKLDGASWAFLTSSSTALLALLYAVFMTSAFNYALQAFANKHSSPTLVTAFFPLQIVFTALFSWAALGKRPRSTDYVGASMIAGGLIAVTAGRLLQSRTSKRQAGLDV